MRPVVDMILILWLAGFLCDFLRGADALVIHYTANEVSIDPNQHGFPAINTNFLLTEVMPL